jgi:hypothetical protein
MRFGGLLHVPAGEGLFTPAGPEDLFVEGRADPRPGEQCQIWDMERVAQIGYLVERTGLTILPETCWPARRPEPTPGTGRLLAPR